MPHKKVIYRNKETPFEIKSEGDWKKIKKSWYVSYICNKCGERHIKIASNLRNAKNTCLKKTLYFSKKTPFEINSEEDWKKIKRGWYVSYICDKCGERHIKNISISMCVKNTCLKNTSYRNKEIPFEINSEEDWKKVKCGWYVSYICDKCGERHIKKVNNLKSIKNTCLKKIKNIKINYHSNYVDRFIFAF